MKQGDFIPRHKAKNGFQALTAITDLFADDTRWTKGWGIFKRKNGPAIGSEVPKKSTHLKNTCLMGSVYFYNSPDENDVAAAIAIAGAARFPARFGLRPKELFDLWVEQDASAIEDMVISFNDHSKTDIEAVRSVLKDAGPILMGLQTYKQHMAELAVLAKSIYAPPKSKKTNGSKAKAKAKKTTRG